MSFVLFLVLGLFLFGLFLLFQLFVHRFSDDFERLQVGVRSLRHRVEIFGQHPRDGTIFTLGNAVLCPVETIRGENETCAIG